MYKDDKGVCIFPGITTVNQSVFLVTLSHPEAYPQIDFKIEEKLEAMLSNKVDEGNPDPRSWEELVQKLHIVAVNTGTFAPYNLPYKNWQRAFYVAGDTAVCLNFVMELDNGIVHTVEHNTKPKYGQFQLKVQIGKNVDLQIAKEDFDYPFVDISTGLDADEMAVTPLQVYPPQGVRPLMVHFEVVNAHEVAMTFFGDTYRHREALSNAGLEMCREEPTEQASDMEQSSSSQQFGRTKRLETFYLMSSRDVSVELQASFVKKLLTNDVENVIIDLRLISTAVKDTQTFQFVQALRDVPNLVVHEV